MARYTGPAMRLQRRSGRNLFLKSQGSKATQRLADKPTPPGQHGAAMQRKMSVYGQQLREKQALRWMYGVLERQFSRYAAKARRQKGVAGTLLLQLLERRLDNVVYRAGYAVTRAQARQLVNHGHVLVNGKKVDIPSVQVRPGDVLTIREKSREMVPIVEALAAQARAPRPVWIEWNEAAGSAKFLAVPSREDLTDVNVNEQLVIEYYAR